MLGEGWGVSEAHFEVGHVFGGFHFSDWGGGKGRGAGEEE